MLGELDRDVVGHVPRLEDPRGIESGLELGDPVGELNRLEVLALLLEIVRPDPERIGNQAAEGTEGDRGEGQDRRGVADHRRPGDAQPLAVPVETPLEEAGESQCDHQDHDADDLVETGAHIGAASSRRVKIQMPNEAKAPPATTTTRRTA